MEVNESILLYDDVQSFKEVVFQSDSEEDFSEGKRLTSLVRESYLKRVRQLLTQNYQVWCDACINAVSGEENMCLLPTNIEKCTRFLEQKALRSCMIASLYQKTMISLISNIKQNTKEMKLFDTLHNIEQLNISTADKCIQTDDAIEKFDVECQTVVDSVITNEKRYRNTSSLLDLPLPDPKDVLQSLGSDFIDGNRTYTKTNPSTNHSKEMVPKGFPQPAKPVCRVIAKRPSCSNDFPPETTKRRKSDKDSGSRCSNKSVPIDKSSKEVIDNFDLICMLTDGNKMVDGAEDDNSSSNNLINLVSNLIDLESKTSANLPNYKHDDTSKGEVYKQNKKNISENLVSLDDRLAEMGILINDDSNSFDLPSTNSSNPVKLPFNQNKGHRCSWFVEMTAHYCNLVKIFLSLSSYKQSVLKEKFIELFGVDDEDNWLELTEDNLAICRKRTANMVVSGLTPYFVAKRIASRQLFKEFAKRVTNSILSRTYAADSGTVNQFITEYFCEHNSIQSMGDINFD